MQAVKKVNQHRSFVRDKIMSCRAAYAIILLRTNAQPKERICWVQKKKQSWRRMPRSYGETWRCNCPFCGWELKLLDLFSPLDESHPSREADAFCSCPLQQHSSELSRRKIPKRLCKLFDRIGTNIHQLPSQSRILFSRKNQIIILPQKYVCFTLFTFYFSSK